MILDLEECKGLYGFENAVKAERDGANVLILKRLEETIRRGDGKKARFQLEHRRLSSENAEVVEVRGSDFTYWLPGEIKGWETESLFEMFCLFG